MTISIPPRIYIISGMQRCGHHAIISWLKGCHDPEPCVSYNHVKTPTSYNNYLVQLEDNEKQGVSYHFFNFENRLPFRYFKDYHRYEKIYIGVTRSFRNWLASAMMRNFQVIRYKKRNKYKTLSKYISAWLAMIKHFQTRNEYLHIYYDNWFSSQTYRNELASILELTLNDINLNYVPRFGGGSSFDKRRFNKKAQEMDVLHRYEHIKDKSFYPLYSQLCEEYKELCGEWY